jgi:hypothetical protein
MIFTIATYMKGRKEGWKEGRERRKEERKEGGGEKRKKQGRIYVPDFAQNAVHLQIHSIPTYQACAVLSVADILSLDNTKMIGTESNFAMLTL